MLKHHLDLGIPPPVPGLPSCIKQLRAESPLLEFLISLSSSLRASPSGILQNPQLNLSKIKYVFFPNPHFLQYLSAQLKTPLLSEAGEPGILHASPQLFTLLPALHISFTECSPPTHTQSPGIPLTAGPSQHLQDRPLWESSAFSSPGALLIAHCFVFPLFCY